MKRLTTAKQSSNFSTVKTLAQTVRTVFPGCPRF
jgi:hypothetical protein